MTLFSNIKLNKKVDSCRPGNSGIDEEIGGKTSGYSVESLSTLVAELSLGLAFALVGTMLGLAVQT